MESVKRSLQERLDYILEMGCASCGMTAGDGGFTGDADAEGPVAGYDPLMKTIKKVKKKKTKVTEAKKELPYLKMMLKASQLKLKDEKDKEKMHKNQERARKIRHHMN